LLVEPWFDLSLVVEMRFRNDSRGWPGRSSYAAMSMLMDKAYVAAEFRTPWGNYGLVAVCSPS
jgi:hypothetical protein